MLRTADPAADGGLREAVFIAADLAFDPVGGPALVDGAPIGAEVVVLDGDADGLTQMAHWARTRTGFDAIHLLSHGEDGAILLGGLRLDRAAVTARRGELAELGAALAGGDLLVYGCNVARGNAGAAFVAALAEATGANVAASATLTGDARLGGDWALEHAAGAVRTPPLGPVEGFGGVLAPVVNNLGGGSVAWAGAGNTVRLDTDADATASDTTLGALNGGLGDWAGATLTVRRVNGGTADATANDRFAFDTTGGLFTVSGNTLQAGGSTFATFADTNGVLTVTFTGAATTATTALVQDALRRVTYRNDTPYGNATLRFALSNGAETTNADVTVTSSTLTVDQTVYDTDGDAADGFNLAEALSKASSGDTIRIKAGNYRGQFVATKAMTITSAGDGTVTLEAPDTQQASAQQTMHGRDRFPILDLRTAAAGAGTITVSNITVDGRFAAPATGTGLSLIGIAAYDTNAVIDGVKVERIAAPLDGQGDYSGNSENFGIVAEGSSAGTAVTLTVRNSTIETFQKTGLLAWGPGLTVDIHDNTITAAGNHGKSNQNGMQIGSAAPRGGVTGTIYANTINNIGSNDPVYNATGILLFNTGAIEAYGNTISSSGGTPGWQGAYGFDISNAPTAVNIHDNTLMNVFIGVIGEGGTQAAAHTLTNNSVNNTYYAVFDNDDVDAQYLPVETGSTVANATTVTVNSAATVNNSLGYLSYYLFAGNDRFTDTGAACSVVYGGGGADTLAAGSGADTLSGGTGADTLSGGGGNDVFAYAATGDGTDTIADFANGDRIRVTGRASASGTVTVGTGTTVAANSVQITAADGVTTLHIDTEGDADAAELTVTLTGTYGVSNFVLDGTDIVGNIPVVTPPAQEETPPTTTRTVDGVVVRETTQTATDGTVTQTLEVPIVTTGRREENAATSNADIPLARDGGTGQPVLEAHLPVGVGLTVESTGTTTGSGLEGLIRAIRNRTQDQPGDQTAMTGVGQTFLDVLPPATNLTVRTIIPVVADPTAPPSAPIVITGTPAVPATGGGTTPGTQQQAIVIDVRNLPRGTVIQLQNVEFAAIVGDVQVTGGEGSQMVVGDSGNQIIVLGADDDTLRGGGGNDFVGSEGGDDQLWGDEGADTVTGGIGNDVLYGNQQDDFVYGNQGADTIFGGQDRDTVFGGQDGDILYGNRADDVLYGQLGDDTLFGGQSDDVLWGGQGNDLLAGNRGADTLYGGRGADVFRINAAEEGGDVIADFEAGVDKLLLFSPNFPGAGGGTLPARHFALDAPATADATFVFNTRTGMLSFDADGSGAGAAVALATLNVRTLGAGDIVLLGPGG
ncbi:DUF4347 domain-containing protein [Azospirillum sp.]|uniref:DUF4347 domain-containing protein n=1 Tax=Azospirillum sp. TaxID=34012 RepID=UPI002D56FB82|nr:DUF4347 domain-containing protein [Azospirillum sp.]HYD66501.1 DUF4347 domain-containing protein [Azospirillum sp.]